MSMVIVMVWNSELYILSWIVIEVILHVDSSEPLPVHISRGLTDRQGFWTMFSTVETIILDCLLKVFSNEHKMLHVSLVVWVMDIGMLNIVKNGKTLLSKQHFHLSIL